jgi:hemolysin-activating ACP:hemolysin acyltransferase
MRRRSARQRNAFALWALANELVAKRIDAGDKRLVAVEWKNGNSMRIINVRMRE